MSSLFDVVEDLTINRGYYREEEEPEITSADETLTRCFEKEQTAKLTHQPLLIVGLLIFLIIQLISINNLYEQVMLKLLTVQVESNELHIYYFELYNNILNHMKHYTTVTLCEFIAIFYFITRWGFNTKISDLFSGIINRRKEKI